jgi:type II secretory pathway pseudopilin PulG
MRGSGDREAGVTIVEVLVAIVILVVGALATFSLLSDANRNDERARQTQVALDLAQQEIEALHSLSNKELALKTVPPHSSNEQSPNFRVNSAQGTFAVERSPVGSYHQMVRNGGAIEGGTGEVIEGGVVEAGPTPFVNGDVKGQIYRYIVWHNDERCGSACGTSKQDYKQIIVAVKLDEIKRQDEERGYVEVQSDFVNPTASAANDPAPNANGEVVTAQQFFLSDTPCSATGSTEREEITGDHLLHNTLGICASGPQTGTTHGAPDALVLGTPPDPDPESASKPEYDYSSDSYLEPVGGNTDEGLQIRRDDTTGCHYTPTGIIHPESQVHRWVTDPMEAEFKMTEKATLKIYSKTLSEATLSTGTICAFLFTRHESGSPLEAKDTLLTNLSGGAGYWAYTPEKNGSWNHGAWGAPLTLTMKFNGAPYTIPAGDRLGLAISVERGNTQTEALEFMYDNPTYPSRIEVSTSTPIEGG